MTERFDIFGESDFPTPEQVEATWGVLRAAKNHRGHPAWYRNEALKLRQDWPQLAYGLAELLGAYGLEVPEVWRRYKQVDRLPKTG